MVCKYCYRKNDHRCIFYPGKKFNINNWDCESLQHFKDLCVVYGKVYKDELFSGNLYVLPTRKLGYVIVHNLRDNKNALLFCRIHEKIYRRISPTHLREIFEEYDKRELIK